MPIKPYWQMTEDERMIYHNAMEIGRRAGTQSTRFQRYRTFSADFRAGHRDMNISMRAFRQGDTGLGLPTWNVANIHALSGGKPERRYNANTRIVFGSRGHEGHGGDGSGVTTFTVVRNKYIGQGEYDLISGVYSFDPRDGDRAMPILELVGLDLTDAAGYSYNWGTRSLVQEFLNDNGSRVWFRRDTGSWWHLGNANWMLCQDDYHTMRKAVYFAPENKKMPAIRYYRAIDLLDDVSSYKDAKQFNFPVTAMLRYDRDAGGWLNPNTGKSIASLKQFRNTKQRRSGNYSPTRQF